MGSQHEVGMSRRAFMATVAAGGAAVTLPAGRAAGLADAGPASRVSLTVNGQRHQMLLDPRVTLLDLLREHLELTSAKKGCDHGQCGACTVLVNGRRVNACLTLAVTLEGDEGTTVEGLAHGDALHPVQQAFLEHDGFRCGFCTSGQICSAVALLAEARGGAVSAVTRDMSVTEPAVLSDEEIRERMSGNICRCGAYTNIVAAVRAATGRRPT